MEGQDWSLGPADYFLAVVVVSLVLASSLVIAGLLRRRLLGGWSGPPSVLATGMLAAGVLVLAAQLLGLFGLFSSPTYPALLVLTAASLWFSPFSSNIDEKAENRGGERGEVPCPPGVGGRPLALVAAAVAAVVLVRGVLVAAGSYSEGMTGFDTHWYHGPFTALFLQSGDTFALNNSIAPQYLSWFYPHTSELLHAIAALPFDRDLLSPGLNLVWLAGAMLAAWCIGRPFGVAPLSLIGACMILGSGLLSDQPGEMRNDLPGVFLVLAAAAIAINGWPEIQRATDTSSRPMKSPGQGLFIGIGISAGLAAGTKLNYLATAGALVVALSFALPRGRRLRGFGTMFAAAFLTGGYWYLRNLIHAGNPLPWITSIGPLDLPGPTQEIGGREGHGVVEYLLDPTVWRDWFLPGLREALTLAWPLILLAATLTVALLVIGRSRTALMRALAAVILATVAAWLIAPASAEGPPGEPVGFVSGLRYLAPALALALALLPVALRLNSSALSDITRGMGAADVRGGPVSTLNGLGSGPARWLVGLVLAAVLLGGGFALQRSYLDGRYAEPDFATPGLNRAFAEASKLPPADRDTPPLAVTSTRIYAFFGPDLRRPVAFVGMPESQGGFRRPETCAEWRSAVNATGAERLIVAWDRISPGQPPLPPEAAWIAADPSATQLSADGGAATFALNGMLDPTTCR